MNVIQKFLTSTLAYVLAAVFFILPLLLMYPTAPMFIVAFIFLCCWTHFVGQKKREEGK
jgi:hypothetical protein